MLPLVAKIHRLATIFIAGGAVSCALWALVTVVARAALPYQLDYEEGNILNAAVRISHGLSAYPDPHALPNVLNPYGPVLYFVVAGLVKVFGVGFVPGRVLVIASGAAIAALIGVVVKRETGSVTAGVAFGAMYLCSPMVQFWWPLLRVDLVGLALSLSGLVVFYSYHVPQANKPTQVRRLEWGTVLAAVLFVAAIYTKHTLVAAPAACVVWAWINGQKKAAIRLTAICVALGGVFFVIGEIATHGALAFALFRTHPDPYRWSAYPEAMQKVVTVHPLLAVLALVLVIGNVWRKNVSLPLLYLGFAAATALTIGKAGSNFNHLLEFIAALCMAAGAGWNYLAELQGVRQLVSAAVAVLMVFLVVSESRELAFEARSSACDQVVSVIRQQPGQLILSENTGAVVMAGKTPLVSNTFVYTQLVKYGGWSDVPLVAMLHQRAVPMVLIDAGRRQLWSKDVMQALRENYHVAFKCDCRHAGLAFVPNKVQSPLATKATASE